MNSTIRLINGSGSNPFFHQFIESVSIFEFFFIHCFTVPLLIIYFHGPEIYNMGFWNGRSNVDICTRITNLTPEFWQTLPDQCDRLVYDRFISFCRQCSYIVWIIWFVYATMQLWGLAQLFLLHIASSSLHSLNSLYITINGKIFGNGSHNLKTLKNRAGKSRKQKKKEAKRLPSASPCTSYPEALTPSINS